MAEVLNEIDMKLHDEIHAEMMRQNPADILANPRLKIFPYVELLHQEINGVVADIGCGSGYASIWLALNRKNIGRIDAIEGSQPAVNELLPRNIEHYDVSSVVNPRYATFDDLGDNIYDYVVAMGAIHHSRNLQSTFDSIFRSLKTGGMLIAQEPAMPDTTTQAEYDEKYNIVEERYGLSIRNGDRYDRFFRECEYKAAIVQSGLDILHWMNWPPSASSKLPFSKQVSVVLRSLRNDGLIATIRKIHGHATNTNKTSDSSWQTQMRHATRHVQSKLIVARKNSTTKQYHRD